MTVLLTGSQGRIGSALRERLPALGWQVRGFDRRAGADVVGELTDPAALDHAMAGIEAVVHLAGQPTEVAWPVIRDSNIEGTFQLFEAARRAGVRRLVYASSNHAVGFTRRPGDSGQLPADTPPRPDTLYGVSKVFGEALARYYCDRYGFEVACLRIGTFAERPPDRRSLASWLSPADCARLVDACLRSPTLGYALIWGISANSERWWSLAAGERLGYHPQDDAGHFELDFDAGPAGSLDLVGGGFTDTSFGIDERAGEIA
ncbi:MAG TPA: NAD(P)-dependent oxidoreductase [Jatrophihabitans sp.]|nr:NAD(P)-dependent oxidoreductase [Jatrophihabitans sp.]